MHLISMNEGKEKKTEKNKNFDLENEKHFERERESNFCQRKTTLVLQTTIRYKL